MMSLPAVTNPSKKELYTIRLLVVMGTVFMIIFLTSFFAQGIISNKWLYGMLLASFLFTCLKLLHEWSHYYFITVPETPPHKKSFTVDILTTFVAGEPYEMIVETLTAIQNITYPHTAYLCDEADDPYLKEVCKKLGVKHVTRVKKINAKAGNINNALQQATGQLCVILDPDHVPQHDFLDPIVSHFNNPKIGFVQIVQAYKNDNESLIAKGAAQQTYQFYGPMMMTMNHYGTVLAIGANCTFRRAALDSIGGHAPGLAEDMNTAMQLHAQGWKSIYVPQILAKGLVPSTLSAYYKQQLKWARGVFELWVTTYIHCFKKFTFLQKLHYGTIPLHYLSGILYLINFLIPVISLLFGIVPVSMGLQTFALVGLPVVAFVVLIRHYVQKWVTKEEERGFHVVGGLLTIGTWWIFILGFIYTIVRKHIPYVPTPKDGNEANNWPLQIPNIITLGISAFAIFYGLYMDWNPYMLFMAGLAAINCLILIFNILAGRQTEFRKFKARHHLVNVSVTKLAKGKGSFWLFRRKVYRVVRSYPVLLATTILCFGLYFFYLASKNSKAEAQIIKKEPFMLSGIFESSDGRNFTSIQQLNNSYSSNTPLDILSLYIPWGDSAHCYIPLTLADSIYSRQSIPMITWEPWENLFRNSDQHNANKNILSKISEGRYDDYLDSFATQVKSLNGPVFLRFAHEFTNPQYPWSMAGNNTPGDFKEAWKYLHARFAKNKVTNAIWVWNPWKPENMAAYFPGRQYVDWIGLDILNYDTLNPDGHSYSFETLYSQFKTSPLFNAGIPVMIAEMGSLDRKAGERWFTDAFTAIRSKFREINAFVIFNNPHDRNMPDGTHGSINWQLPQQSLQRLVTANRNVKNGELRPTPLPDDAEKSSPIALANIKGVNYNRALNWRNNKQPVFRRDIIKDFKEIKSSGINAVKIFEPGVYKRNIFLAARQQGIGIHYSFWIPDGLDFITDTMILKKFAGQFLKSVKELKSNKNIISWNIGNPQFQYLHERYNEPLLYYQKQAYLNWINSLAKLIKNEDPERAIAVEFQTNPILLQNAGIIWKRLEAVDYLGLIVTSDILKDSAFTNLKMPFYISSINGEDYLANEAQLSNANIFIAEWQDQNLWRHVTLNGLKDVEGNKTNSLVILANLWSNQKQPNHLIPKIKILRPAATTFAGTTLYYHALIFKEGKWIFPASNLNFDWYLVKTDRYKNPVSTVRVGNGPQLSLTIPYNPQQYKLYLIASENGQSTTATSPLNLPLAN